MIGVQLSAVDTLYFRESTPYAANLTSPEHPGGRFPPHPATVVGAVRALLARGQGWSGGPWPPELTKVLGDGHGPDDLGQLRFDGPYLLRGGEPVFAMPAHLLGEPDGETWKPLRPGTPVACDLGEAVRLPMPPSGSADDAHLLPGADRWLTRTAMAAVLRGGVPAPGEVIRSEELWCDELRVGIGRDDTTRTVREGMLYTSRHVRPASDVTIGVRAGGVPDGWWDRCGDTMPLGGEGRWAESQPWNGDAACETPVAVLEGRPALVVALTPIDAGDEFYRAGGRIAGLGDATIVSACLPRVERVGGWAATDRKGGRPLPLRSILPAGSTFFCEIGDPERLRAAIDRAGGRPRVGQRQRWGFGAVAIGLWPDTMEVSR